MFVLLWFCPIYLSSHSHLASSLCSIASLRLPQYQRRDLIVNVILVSAFEPNGWRVWSVVSRLSKFSFARWLKYNFGVFDFISIVEPGVWCGVYVVFQSGGNNGWKIRLKKKKLKVVSEISSRKWRQCVVKWSSWRDDDDDNAIIVIEETKKSKKKL